MSDEQLQRVHKALESVVDPNFGKPMIELGLIRDIEVDGSKASMTVTIHAATDSLKREVQSLLETATAPLGVTAVDVNWQVDVPIRQLGGEDPVPEVRNVILVMSGKGGVGKSTCAVNLALALSRAGTRVGLLDADIYGPSIPMMLGVKDNPRSTDGKRIEPLQRFGVKLMSIGFMIESEKDAIIWRGPMLMGALTQFLSDVDWGALDYLILDLPPGTGDVAISLAQKVKTTGAVVVTTPQEIALQDVYKSVSMCKKLNIPILGVVENMSAFVDSAGVTHEIFGSGGGEKIAQFAEAPLLGQIPLDPAIREQGDGGTPIVQSDPQHPAALAFVAVADALSTRIAVDSFARGGGKGAPETSAPRRLKILR